MTLTFIAKIISIVNQFCYKKRGANLWKKVLVLHMTTNVYNDFEFDLEGHMKGKNLFTNIWLAPLFCSKVDLLKIWILFDVKVKVKVTVKVISEVYYSKNWDHVRDHVRSHWASLHYALNLSLQSILRPSLNTFKWVRWQRLVSREYD